MSRLVLGVDGGGTKTIAAIADEQGRVHGEGRSGSTNHDDLSDRVVAENLDEAVRQARAQGGTDAPFAAVFLGLAGIVSQYDHDRVREIVARTAIAGSERIAIDHDIRVALAGGLAGRPGIVLIAGTGTACYGRLEDGSTWQSGGWGHLLADEGSGYWLGLGALRAALQMHDGRLAPTGLDEWMLSKLGLTDPGEVMHRIYVEGMTRSDIAALGRDVLRLAQEGDPACGALLDEGARELVRCVLAVQERLASDDGPLEVTTSGGLLGASSPLLAAIAERLAAEAPGTPLVAPELPPVVGACLLALQELVVAGPGVVANLREYEGTG